ncbi:alpha/beta fold hydrolase [Niallia nealsonii]|uniref:Alpha/beta hydrolase n=1 Tax=Niallia nealsonii TaxID=115979 RepID=A0A2N0Z5I2_9BACI|nr:alpha/beta hydrolase [Niallia nealsonii]PKG24771.1 alpha/beta hydrolase [Niallia nealsonii]
MKFFSRKADFTISKNGMNVIETIQIGGIKQSILIQTEDIKNPMLFVLHGGPSMPIPGISNRGADYTLITCTKRLVKHFTLVYWDQRGTGKSYSKDIPKETMHLKQFIRDAKEITDYLLKRFKQPKLHIMAYSWGTIIGLPLISQYPDLFYSYTALSQVTNWGENDKLSYRWLLKKAKETNNQKAINELTRIGEPPYLKSFKKWNILQKWLFKYKSMIYDAKDKGTPTYFKMFQMMLTSPDYTLKDIYHSLITGMKLAYSEQMLYDLNHFNFPIEIPKVEIPVLFIHGKKDKHIMPKLIQDYFEKLDAPEKRLYWAKKSSHIFHLDDAKEIEQILIDNLREWSE